MSPVNTPLLDRVRFPAPLPVGSEWRGGGEIVSVDEVPGGLQVKFKATVEVKGSEVGVHLARRKRIARVEDIRYRRVPA